MSPATREAVNDTAKAEGWKCTRCGAAIRFEDRDAYQESKRCAICHYEVDTESGTISNL